MVHSDTTPRPVSQSSAISMHEAAVLPMRTDCEPEWSSSPAHMPASLNFHFAPVPW